jgi:hypothetical protein
MSGSHTYLTALKEKAHEVEEAVDRLTIAVYAMSDQKPPQNKLNIPLTYWFPLTCEPIS